MSQLPGNGFHPNLLLKLSTWTLPCIAAQYFPIFFCSSRISSLHLPVILRLSSLDGVDTLLIVTIPLKLARAGFGSTTTQTVQASRCLLPSMPAPAWVPNFNPNRNNNPLERSAPTRDSGPDNRQATQSSDGAPAPPAEDQRNPRDLITLFAPVTDTWGRLFGKNDKEADVEATAGTQGSSNSSTPEYVDYIFEDVDLHARDDNDAGSSSSRSALTRGSGTRRRLPDALPVMPGIPMHSTSTSHCLVQLLSSLFSIRSLNTL
jgi:hypothetical protein